MPRVSIDDRRRWPASTTGQVVVVPKQPELPVVRAPNLALPATAKALPVTAKALPHKPMGVQPLVIVHRHHAGSQPVVRSQSQRPLPQLSVGDGSIVTRMVMPRPSPKAISKGRTVARWAPPPLPVVVAMAHGPRARALPEGQTRSMQPVVVNQCCLQPRTSGLPVVTVAIPKPPVLARTRRTKRKSIGSEFESHAALEAAKQAREVEELIGLMPPMVSLALLGGAPGAQQVRDPEDRAKTLFDAVALKAGPDGSSLANARRAWSAFKEYATGLSLPDSGLPAKPALVASFLRAEAQRAASGTGAQGGTTVANSRRVGLLWLKEKLGFPIDVDNIVAMGAANPGQLRAHRRADPSNRKRKQAGSLPLKAYAQIETLAAATSESPVRFFARSLLSFSMLQSVRAVDALRTVEDADEHDSAKVMSGFSYVSKDGEPMKTFAPARGVLGDLDWWPEHRDAVRAAGLAFPKWNQPYGSKGRVTHALPGPPLQAVMPKAHLVASIRACLQASPLSLSDDAFDDLGITAHSEHGSPSDMLTIIGPHSHFGSFLRDDVREIGHWLRLGALEDNHEQGRAGAQGRRRGAPPGRQATGAFTNNAAEMAAAYCQGNGREGRRTAQLRVRNRWISAVKMALTQYGGHWTTLPPGRGDYEILQAGPPQAA